MEIKDFPPEVKLIINSFYNEFYDKADNIFYRRHFAVAHRDLLRRLEVFEEMIKKFEEENKK